MKFAYEDLEVWNKAVDFTVKVIDTVIMNLSQWPKKSCQ